MTDSAGGGNANNGNAGGDGGGNGGGSNGSGGNQNTNVDFLAGLSQDNRQFAESKGWKTAADVNKAFDSHRSLEKQFSGRGQQHKLSDYAFNAPSNAKDIGYSTDFADAFKQGAHKLNLDPQMAASLHDWFSDYAGKSIEAGRAAHAKAIEGAAATAETELVKAFGGDTNNPAFKRQQELASRAMRLLKLDGEKLGVMGKVGDKLRVIDPQAFAALAKVGQAMFAEDHLHGEGVGSVNPFDPKSTDTRQQSIIMNQDPDRAEQLIRSLNPNDQKMWQMFLGKQDAKRKSR